MCRNKSRILFGPISSIISIPNSYFFFEKQQKIRSHWCLAACFTTGKRCQCFRVFFLKEIFSKLGFILSCFCSHIWKTNYNISSFYMRRFTGTCFLVNCYVHMHSDFFGLRYFNELGVTKKNFQESSIL